MEKACIELQGISKSYYSETAVTQALRRVSLSFYRGEFVAITGESGGGKSTLLNMIGGMDTFDEGEMFVDGEPTFQYDDEEWEEFRRSKIGYVFQDYSLIGHYSVLDNVVSALLVLGVEEKKAKETAVKYLEEVGLAEYVTHRASELSSGQKQRLSIARALAKNTDVIVADEPTGNLDSETGDQIVKLLGELSKDRLVIMVTHNYEQAAPYVTRKIRIHDGQVISDVQVNEGKEMPVSENMDEAHKEVLSVEKLPVQTMDRKWQHKVAALFAKKNGKTQVGRTVLFTSFLFIISLVSFIFIVELFMNWDDYSTRDYSHSTFYREDNTRLVAKRADGAELTAEDLETIKSTANVVTADSCDYANDINFYLEPKLDYHFIYSDGNSRTVTENEDSGRKIDFLNDSRFMMSADAIDESDLAAGRLPQSMREIVLYSEDESVLNQSKACYFQAKNLWDSTEYVEEGVTIVGLLKKKTDQVYFSQSLCRMLSAAINCGKFRICYQYDKNFGDYRKKTQYIPLVNEELTGNQVRMSQKADSDGMPPNGEQVFLWQPSDDAEGEAAEQEDKTDTVDVMAQKHMNTTAFMEMSQEFFDKYYPDQSTQASVYITSYAKTDSVIRSLEKKGYKAISTFRLSANEYVQEKVDERLTIIAISAFGLLALLVAELLILRSLMKIRMKDYLVLKFIGMKLPVIKKISYYEIGGYTVLAMVITVILMWILRFAGVSVVPDLMWYVSVPAYLLFVLYNLVLAALTVAFFNRLLKGRLNS